MASGKIGPYKLIPHVLKALVDLYEAPQTPTVDNIVDQVETNFELSSPNAKHVNLGKRVRDALKKGMEMGLFTQKKHGIFEIQLPMSPTTELDENYLSEEGHDACCPRRPRCRRRCPTPCCRRRRCCRPCCRRRPPCCKRRRRCCVRTCNNEDDNNQDMNDGNKATGKNKQKFERKKSTDNDDSKKHNIQRSKRSEHILIGSDDNEIHPRINSNIGQSREANDSMDCNDDK